MNRWTLIPGVLLWSILCATVALARGGGGCVEQGTLISTPSGTVAVETLRAGDGVWSVEHGQLVRATVQAVTRVDPVEYVELSTASHRIRVTSEHPIQTAVGAFVIAGRCVVGEVTLTWVDGRAQATRLQTIRHIPADRPAYNLLVMPGGTFIANGVIVHNKGCFLPDTPILKPGGAEMPISAVRSGDVVEAFEPDGALVPARVQNIITHEVEEYFIVRTDRVELRVTAEHPFYVGDGRFRTLESLRVGDSIYALDGSRLSPQNIASVERRAEHTRVYNLQTEQPHTYFAAGIAVHNKGGCFPAGTLIRTPSGSIAIEQVAPLQQVHAIDEDGRLTVTTVLATHIARSAILDIQTDLGTLHTTPEHPLRTPSGDYRPAGELAVGRSIMFAEGSRLVPAEILSLRERGEQDVYNLAVAPPHTFIADGFVVHNKGGHSSGSRYHGRSRGSSTQPSSGGALAVLIFVAGAIGVVVVVRMAASAASSGRDDDLDYCYSASAVAPKMSKTLRVLEYLARKDTSVDPKSLQKLAESTFTKLQSCWQARSYGEMKPLMMPDLYVQHMGQIAAMIRQHEINVIENLVVHGVDLVGVHYTREPEQRSFTALITATACDYYIDDRTRKFLRGDRIAARFQEFWTFQWHDGQWLLRQIEQTRESGILKEQNIAETVSPEQLAEVYGASANAVGPAGPAREPSVALRATRVEQLLQSLAKHDPLWDSQLMNLRARKIFMDVMLARQSDDPGALPESDVYPEMAGTLRQEMQQRQQQGERIEYRNLCVRNVELILIRNRIDDTQDEFTARISAHALIVHWKGGSVIDEQPYVTPFVSFWTFGRRENQWCLKEILPQASGMAAMGRENTNEGGP